MDQQTKALGVILLTPAIRTWLAISDPKALEQAEAAYEAGGGRLDYLDPERCDCGKNDWCPLWGTGRPTPEALAARNKRMAEREDSGDQFWGYMKAAWGREKGK